MPAFFVALRESVHDPEEMQLYADKAAGHQAVQSRSPPRSERCISGAPQPSFAQNLSEECRWLDSIATRDVTWVQWQAARARRHGRSAQLERPFFESRQAGEMSPSGPRALSSRPRHAGAARRTCERTHD
jgi:hypothetical protein